MAQIYKSGLIDRGVRRYTKTVKTQEVPGYELVYVEKPPVLAVSGEDNDPTVREIHW